MAQQKIKGLLSSMLSSEIKGISGADLEILSIIYSHKSIEDSELEKQFSAPNYHQITSYLHANHYIKCRVAEFLS
jgi:hypothetical protein